MPARSAESLGVAGAGRCVVCGASSGVPVADRDGHALVQCACGAMFLVPEPGVADVDPRVDHHPDSFYALPAAMKVAWLARSHPGGTLLEVGCGRGHFLAAAQRRGYRVAGIEVDASRARAVADRLGVSVENALVEASHWPDASCDLVYHCDLLSHFPDPLRALARMRRMLRPDGAMFFEVGLVGGLSAPWYRRMPPGSWPRHRWFFDERSLAALLDRAGFRIVRLQTYSLGPQVLLFRGASRLLGFGRRLLGRRAPSRGERELAAPRERPLEGRINNWLRFGLGRVAPRLGPATALVLAVGKGGAS